MNSIKELLEKYNLIEEQIIQRLNEFKNIPENKYFYELCYCICTPQSKAENALIVQHELEKSDFLNKDFNPIKILENKSNYIRFHNQKSKRLMDLKNNFHKVMEIINSNSSVYEKRNLICNEINGIGMKESSHFLRNIGFNGLAILDRHILNNLVQLKVFNEIPKINSQKKYIAVEKIFLEFSYQINIPIDELDLLFWSNGTGIILK